MTGSRRVKTTNKLTSTEQKNTDCFAEGLQNTKVTIASTSSPRAPTTGAPLKSRQVVDIKPTKQTDSHNLQTNNDALFALQEVEWKLDNLEPGSEQPEIAVRADQSIFTREFAPFKTEWVHKILWTVKIDKDLLQAEQVAVRQLVKDFADVFFLSFHEVKHIPGVLHKLHVPEDAELSKKIGQKPLTLPQAAYFSKALDVIILLEYVPLVRIYR